MHYSKLMLRASAIALVFGALQGCSGVPAAPADDEFAVDVIEELYSSTVYITGSRIPRKVDVRRSAADYTTAQLIVVKAAR
jgi:hypothetical protein